VENNILLIDDDEEIYNLFKLALGPLIHIDYAKDYEQGLKLAKENRHLLYILDLNLGEKLGLGILEEFNGINGQKNNFLILTGENHITDEIKGHALGVREYLKKPLPPKLLRAIIEKNLASIKQVSPQNFENDFLRINYSGHSVQLKDGNKLIPCQLTLKEFNLLSLFVNNPNKALSREFIYKELWADDSQANPRTIDMHLSSLRKKLLHHGSAIQTIRSVGHRYVPNMDKE
jgi:DNA-binding response OmpR family regulator